nr:photosystem I assembly protein Ycf36 [Hemiselmis andersenii]
MNIPTSECPVPLDQRPMNEYSSLKESTFFTWTTKTIEGYLKQIVILITAIYGLTGAIINSSFSNSEAKVNVILYTLVFGTFFLSLIFLRVYLGWLYIYERLVKATVTYEESGWYDGQVWIKPPEILIQDTLVATYELLPIINRIKISLISCFTIMIFNILYLNYFG